MSMPALKRLYYAKREVQKITGYLPDDDGLKHALTGADVVLIPAGIPRTYSRLKMSK